MLKTLKCSSSIDGVTVGNAQNHLKIVIGKNKTDIVLLAMLCTFVCL